MKTAWSSRPHHTSMPFSKSKLELDKAATLSFTFYGIIAESSQICKIVLENHYPTQRREKTNQR